LDGGALAVDRRVHERLLLLVVFVDARVFHTTAGQTSGGTGLPATTFISCASSSVSITTDSFRPRRFGTPTRYLSFGLQRRFNRLLTDDKGRVKF
jgi:hypothetical protein